MLLAFMTERGTPTPPGREVGTPLLLGSETDAEVEEEEEDEVEGLLLGCDTPPPLDPLRLIEEEVGGAEAPAG